MEAPMDPISIFWKEQTEGFQKMSTFTHLWCIVFEIWLFVLGHVMAPQNCLYPPPPSPSSVHTYYNCNAYYAFWRVNWPGLLL